MRYGNAHNVHKKNKGTDFTRQPEDINEMLGNFQKGTNRGEHTPILEEGYSYQGGEDMVAVGEVGVSKRYGGGRDGTHHKMEKRMVYKKAPKPEEKEEKTAAPVDEGPKGPEAPEPPVSYSDKYVNSRAQVQQFEENQAEGNSFYGADQQQDDAQSFADAYKQKINNKYEQDEDGNYVDRDQKAQYDEDYAQYEVDKAEFDAQQEQQSGVSAFLQKKKDALNMQRDF